MPRVTRTPQAGNDLADLFRNLTRLSKPGAAKTRAALAKAFKILARSPGLGRARPELRPDLFSYAVGGQYIIFYRVISNGIEVARVLSGARDVGPSMFDD